MQTCAETEETIWKMVLAQIDCILGDNSMQLLQTFKLVRYKAFETENCAVIKLPLPKWQLAKDTIFTWCLLCQSCSLASGTANKAPQVAVSHAGQLPPGSEDPKAKSSTSIMPMKPAGSSGRFTCGRSNRRTCSRLRTCSRFQSCRMGSGISQMR